MLYVTAGASSGSYWDKGLEGLLVRRDAEGSTPKSVIVIGFDGEWGQRRSNLYMILADLFGKFAAEIEIIVVEAVALRRPKTNARNVSV